jgi:hypothetical protein
MRRFAVLCFGGRFPARRRVVSGSGLALLCAAWLTGCDTGEPPAALREASVEASPPEAEESSPYDGIELPPFEPLPLSPPELERPWLSPALAPPPAAPASGEDEAETPPASLDMLPEPLEEDVSLQGGVPVGERDEPDAETARKSTPRVGVEGRF